MSVINDKIAIYTYRENLNNLSTKQAKEKWSYDKLLGYVQRICGVTKGAVSANGESLQH